MNASFHICNIIDARTSKTKWNKHLLFHRGARDSQDFSIAGPCDSVCSFSVAAAWINEREFWGNDGVLNWTFFIFLVSQIIWSSLISVALPMLFLLHSFSLRVWICTFSFTPRLQLLSHQFCCMCGVHYVLGLLNAMHRMVNVPYRNWPYIFNPVFNKAVRFKQLFLSIAFFRFNMWIQNEEAVANHSRTFHALECHFHNASAWLTFASL